MVLSSLKAVADELKSRPEVRYCGISAGRFDLIVEAFFIDQEHVVRFCTDVLGATPGITDVETSIILRIEKFAYEWDIAL